MSIHLLSHVHNKVTDTDPSAAADPYISEKCVSLVALLKM